jgi:cellulose synthase/poly-beta-1,6-N-acetylglucosamine synthase-like glycosyltransferase
MAEPVFWLSLIFVLYAYFGYPLVLVAWKWLRPRPVHKKPLEVDVTLVMAARNEQYHILQKILNCLNLDYPRDRLQIIVSLDGPTDGTEVLVLGYAGQGIQVTYAPRHKGKAAAINTAVARARGSIIVFVDARQMLARNVIRELTANFSDPTVGAVSGELAIVDDGSERHGPRMGIYWTYETLIRSLESSVHSVVGATGALYAIRRSLFRELPDDTILDDVQIPMNIVLQGRRVILDREARAFDRPTGPEQEFGRKVRTLAGNFQLIARMPELFNFRRNPVFFQFISHKVSRLFIPYALMALLISNLFLTEGIYLVFLGLQFLWYGLALAGYLATRWRAPSRPAGISKAEERI